MNEIEQRLTALRAEMEQRNISVYIIPTADFHESEYVNDYFKARKYMTGFTGSAGTAVITRTEAGLWTDGRYFIQAEKQLAGSGIELFRMGMEGVPTVREYVKEKMEQGTYLGFDGRTMNAAAGESYEKLAQEQGAQVAATEDLVGLIWKDRPQFPVHPIFLLEECYTGESTADKLLRVREKMKECGADWHVLSSLCDIAWLLNVRGGDIAHVPVAMSYLLMSDTECCWYVNPLVFRAQDDNIYMPSDVSENDIVNGNRSGSFFREAQLRAALTASGITIKDYEEFYEDLEKLPESDCILLEKSKINLKMLNSLPEKMKIVDKSNPEELMKAVKNPTELDNIKKAHIKDGVAMTKFCYWLKTNIGRQRITEWSASEYLEQLRREQEGFIDISFDTISAYGANAAMMHYSPSKENEVELCEKGFLLVDSGGHYMEGSTDITRNIVLGPLSEEEKRMFTAVTRACLNLANARFLYGCCGQNLDILARGPLWQIGMDYRCGTGHGNGYLLNVHEGPNGFRWKIVPERHDSGVLEEGMVTTDEPGVYIEGKYGIRIENELVCRKWIKNEYGQFMEFENITYAPIDLDAVIPEEMTATERLYLNEYHKKVYEVIAPYLTVEEKEWLREYTREI